MRVTIVPLVAMMAVPAVLSATATPASAACGPASASYELLITEDQPLRYYRLDGPEAPGTTEADLGTQCIDATYGSLSVRSPSSPTDGSGSTSGQVGANGSTNLLSSTISFGEQTVDRSVEFWARAEGPSADSYWSVMLPGLEASASSFYNRVTVATPLGGFVFSGQSSAWDGGWHHIAISFTSVAGTPFVELFVDGLAVGEAERTSTTVPTSSSGALSLDVTQFNSTPSTAVAVAEFAVFDRPLTSRSAMSRATWQDTPGCASAATSGPERVIADDGPLIFFSDFGPAIGSARLLVDRSGRCSNGITGSEPGDRGATISSPTGAAGMFELIGASIDPASLSPARTIELNVTSDSNAVDSYWSVRAPGATVAASSYFATLTVVSGGAVFTVDGLTEIWNGRRHHIMVTASGSGADGSVTVYVDGQQAPVTRGGSALQAPGSDVVSVYTQQYSVGPFTSVTVDNVAIYDKVLGVDDAADRNREGPRIVSPLLRVGSTAFVEPTTAVQRVQWYFCRTPTLPLKDDCVKAGASTQRTIPLGRAGWFVAAIITMNDGSQTTDVLGVPIENTCVAGPNSTVDAASWNLPDVTRAGLPMLPGPHADRGCVRLNLFIGAERVGTPLPGWSLGGNNRSFNPRGGIRESKLTLNLDFVRGRASFGTNSTEITRSISPLPVRTNTRRPFPSRVAVFTNRADWELSIEVSRLDREVNAASIWLESDPGGGGTAHIWFHGMVAVGKVFGLVPLSAFSPSIDGLIEVRFDPSGQAVLQCVDRNAMPSLEMYQDTLDPNYLPFGGIRTVAQRQEVGPLALVDAAGITDSFGSCS
jgi:hypothetical protein